LATDAAVTLLHEQNRVRDERPVVVLFDGWTSLFRERVVPWRIGMAEKNRTQFETDTLPRYIETQRWYARKARPSNGCASRKCAVAEGKTTWLWHGGTRRTEPRAGYFCRWHWPGRNATTSACGI